MRVAIFTDIYAPYGNGGIASSVKAQKDELEALGHDVTVFCPGFNAKEPHVVVVPSHKLVRINHSIVARRPPVVEQYILANYPNFADFDVVHVHYEASCSLAGIRLAKRFGLPLVQTMHGREDMAIQVNIPHPFKSLVADVLYRLHRHYLPPVEIKVRRDKFQATTLARAKMWQLMVEQAELADVVITPSNHFARKLEHYGVTHQIQVVSNGIPDALMPEDPPIRELDDGAVLKIIWNSRVSREKRIRPFLQAIRMLERPYLLYIYGDGNDLRWAKHFVQKHHLKAKFFGYAKREKIAERMQKSHLAVMASYNFDTQGMTLLEAEATGLPVFFCDPAMIEVVPPESYVLAGGPEAAAMAIALNSFPAAKIATMSKQMLKHRSEIRQSVQIKKLLAAYKMAIMEHPRGGMISSVGRKGSRKSLPQKSA